MLSQECWYFPLREQIQRLLHDAKYRDLLIYEKFHREQRKDDNFMCDVYDSPRWKDKVGDFGESLSRIVIHGCVDGCPAFQRKQTLSVKPLQYTILNYAPWIRYRAKYMLVHALIPAHLKGIQAKKYYDWLGQNEMTPLYQHGVDGVRVIMYGNTLDTPGRREILAMQAITAFYPCPHCLHTWQPGRRGQVYCGYRRFLPLDSPWRQRNFRFMGRSYEFRDVERRTPPRLRDDVNVPIMCARGSYRRPFLGHKGLHFFSTWEGVDWDGNTCDVMHDLKLLCEMILKVLVGTRSSQGCYKEWSSKKKDDKHRQDCQVYGVFREFFSSTESTPPWRLSKEEIRTCDSRVKSIWWPRYMDPLVYGGHSFWTHSDRMWKCSHKAYVLLVILPTCLYGFVPEVHTALLMLVSALRRLKGQVYCLEEARRRCFIPGSNVT